MKKLATALILLTAIYAGTAAALTFETKDASIRQSPDHGHLAWNGDVAEYVYVPAAGLYQVTIVAAGMPAEGVWPLMAFRVNGITIEDTYVPHADYRAYAFQIELSAGTHTIGAGFLNDAYVGGEDRNLLLDTVAITPDAQLSTEGAWIDSAEARENALVAQSGAAIAQHRMGAATISVVDESGNPVQGATVAVEQTSHDFLFGSNIFGFDIFGSEQNNEEYKARFAELFNYATAPFYWALLEPEQGQPQYALCDAIADWCDVNGIRVKGHAVLYGDAAMIPPWSPSEETQLARVTEVLQRYEGQIAYWDLVNEPYNAPGMLFEPAYALARDVSPGANLIVNSYGQFYMGLDGFFANGHQAFYEFMEQTVANGMPFDAIGIQAHAPLDTAFPMDQVVASLDKYAAFGKEIHLTEFAPCSNGNAVLGAPWRGVWDEAEQADYAEKFYRICFAHPSVEAVTWWDFCDVGAWLEGGGMLRTDLSPKPVFDALKTLIHEEWHTDLVGQTAASGGYAFSGYHGEYRVTVDYEDSSVETDFHVEKGADNTLTIVVEGGGGTPDTPPVIALIGASQAYVEAGGAYVDAGATAMDAEDGDLTALMVVSNQVDVSRTGQYPVYYNVSDSAGNEAERVTRMVLVSDTTPPAITLQGADHVTLDAGGTYTDSGATAHDVFEGDLTAQIVTVSNVDTSAAGTYTVAYNVSDGSGNGAPERVRTVEVVAVPQGDLIGIIGDVNHDGAIDSWDATLIRYIKYYGESRLNRYLRWSRMNEADSRLADVDLDGSVAYWDADVLEFVLANGLEAANAYLASQGRNLAHVGEALYE